MVILWNIALPNSAYIYTYVYKVLQKYRYCHECSD